MKNLLILLLLAGLGWCYYHHSLGMPSWSQNLDDASISAQVLEKIAGDSPMALLSVKVSTHGGVVSLNGEVPTPEEKNLLDQDAKSVKGVHAVVNNLTVSRHFRNPKDLEKDVEIMASVKKKLVEEEGLRALDIHVEVYEGQVVLTGHVPSAEQSLLAQKLASETPGVRLVQNHIELLREGQ